MLEKTVKAAVRKRLKEIKAFQFWPVQFGIGSVVIDCIGCYEGEFFGIECKVPGAKPTKMQEHTLEEIHLAGGLVYVIDNVEDAYALFTDHPPPLAKSASAIRPRLRVVARRTDD
jgi:hypothetical protein